MLTFVFPPPPPPPPHPPHIDPLACANGRRCFHASSRLVGLSSTGQSPKKRLEPLRRTSRIDPIVAPCTSAPRKRVGVQVAALHKSPKCSRRVVFRRSCRTRTLAPHGAPTVRDPPSVLQLQTGPYSARLGVVARPSSRPLSRTDEVSDRSGRDVFNGLSCFRLYAQSPASREEACVTP